MLDNDVAKFAYRASKLVVTLGRCFKCRHDAREVTIECHFRVETALGANDTTWANERHEADRHGVACMSKDAPIARSRAQEAAAEKKVIRRKPLEPRVLKHFARTFKVDAHVALSSIIELTVPRALLARVVMQRPSSPLRKRWENAKQLCRTLSLRERS